MDISIYRMHQGGQEEVMQGMNVIPANDVQGMLEEGGTLVTVNRRLAKYAVDRFSRARAVSGLEAWETPDILPLENWIERCLDDAWVRGDGDTRPVMLSPLQERVLWEQVIAEHLSEKPLLRRRAVAQIVQQAWQLCVAWRIPIGSGTLWGAVDAAAFVSWAEAFMDQCRRNNWLDRPRLADALIDAVAAGEALLPKNLVFSGFDDFSPQLSALVEALASRGVGCFVQAFPDRAGKGTRTGYPDEQAELEAAAKWARERLLQNPGEHLGVIVNGLGRKRDMVCRVFEEILHPSSLISFESGKTPAFNISMGKPLAAYPLINSALLIFDMVRENPEIQTLSALLLSPFTRGAETELARRARLDGRIRQSKQLRIPMMQVIGWVNGMGAHGSERFQGCPIMAGSIQAFEAISLDMPERQSAAGWCGIFGRLLDAMGWPGDKSLGSDEYQVLAAFQETLARFGGVGEMASDLTFFEAQDQLRRLLEETLFQPETEDVNLQVMGLLEAAGEAFDAVWISGLTSDVWPVPPAPNPFIPISIQRLYGLPHASATRELGFARKVTRRILASADTVIVSYPLVSGDSPLSPSSLIEHLPVVDAGMVHGEEDIDYRAALAASGSLEEFRDEKGPPLEQGETISGGTGVLKLQSACPFSAFARYRLGAEPLVFPDTGLDAADRGILVHQALEAV